ncbi:hypothetical protein [Pseudoalteromonas sp. MTN2-4]|uniref:hypothetical protein n=1 Tax=Pseudoalteromonas sp. MTN2-4 TaxID=3056555 RepID=UPI0036F32779
MKFLVLLFALPFSVFAQAQKVSPEISKKIESIKKYSPLLGEWEGKYFIKSAPDELIEIMAKDGSDKTGIGIKIILKEKSTEVYFKYTSESDWEKSDANIQVVPDKLGWHVYLTREGGNWLERIWLSIARTKEKTGALTVTRTVHNWYNTENSGAPDHYYTFGAGELKKI